MPGAGSTEEGVMLKAPCLCGAGGEAGSMSVGKVGKPDSTAAVGRPLGLWGEEALVKRICRPKKPKESRGSA